MRFRSKNFAVYQDAKIFCTSCREIVNSRIKQQDRDLAGQIERALNSIVLNIAEGSADNSDLEFSRFLSISIRSVYEVVAGFDLALLYGMVGEETNDKIEMEAHEMVKKLSAFRNTLKKKWVPVPILAIG
jgi:four helix bundle protein